MRMLTCYCRPGSAVLEMYDVVLSLNKLIFVLFLSIHVDADLLFQIPYLSIAFRVSRNSRLNY